MSHSNGDMPNGGNPSADLDFDMNGLDDDVLEDITNMESTFYQEGYRSGFEHGKLHGIFEGRQLGNEKSWELWEEIGYYEGWANVWVGQLEGKAKDVEKDSRSSRRGKEARALNHAQALLELIASFPTTNPTPAATPAPAPAPAPTSLSSSAPIAPTSSYDSDESRMLGSTITSAPGGSQERERDPTDLASLISQIRAKYKLLCSSLGTRPRLAVAQIVGVKPGSGAANASANANANVGDSASSSSGVVSAGGPAQQMGGFEGPLKGVDTRQLRF